MKMPIQLCRIAIAQRLIVVAGKVITLNENYKNDKRFEPCPALLSHMLQPLQHSRQLATSMVKPRPPGAAVLCLLPEALFCSTPSAGATHDNNNDKSGRESAKVWWWWWWW
jgi:hypothetical protein